MRQKFFVLLVTFAVALNVMHPLFHALEGGTIDSVLDFVTAWAAQFLSLDSVQTSE